MGIGRWLHCRAVNDDIKTIQDMPEREREALFYAIQIMVTRMKIEHHIHVGEIIESEKFNIVNNASWLSVPLKISRSILIPMAAKYDKNTAMNYLAVSVILHSVRAVVDYEFNSNKKLTLWCQKMWSLVAPRKELIPKRFQ